MSVKTPEALMQKIAQAIQTRDGSIIKNFLEEFALEIVESQKPTYERMLIEAAGQGIVSERERCIAIIDELCSIPELKAKLVKAIQGDQAQIPQSLQPQNTQPPL